MSGTRETRIPPFLEGEPLPKGYFEVPDPYESAPTRKINLSELVAYARRNGKSRMELSKEDVAMFAMK